MWNEVLSIWAVYSTMPVINTWVLELFARRGIQFDTLSGDSLKRSEREGCCFNSVGWCYNLLLSENSNFEGYEDLRQSSNR